MKNIALLAFLPALTCAFFLPISPLFMNELSNSSHVSHVSHVSNTTNTTNTTNTSYTQVGDVNMTDADLMEICTIVHFAESELCGNTSSTSLHKLDVPPQLCYLLSLMNQTFCQDEMTEKEEKEQKEEKEEKEQKEEKHIYENVYEKFYENVYIEEIKNNNTDLTPKDLCPIFDLVDKTFCPSHDNNKLNPKDLCPLLEFVEKEVCV